MFLESVSPLELSPDDVIEIFIGAPVRVRRVTLDRGGQSVILDVDPGGPYYVAVSGVVHRRSSGRVSSMTSETLSVELVNAIGDAVREAGVESARSLAQVLDAPRAQVVAPSGAVLFLRRTVYPDGVPIAVAEVDRLRVTMTNRGASSVFLHAMGQPLPTEHAVELAAGEERTIATRDGVWASCTVAAGSVRVDVVLESVGS